MTTIRNIVIIEVRVTEVMAIRVVRTCAGSMYWNTTLNLFSLVEKDLFLAWTNTTSLYKLGEPLYQAWFNRILSK
jgi:hypothetical protein